MGRDSDGKPLRRAAQDDVLRKFEIGVRRGVARALEEHRRAGRSIVVWKDGKIVWIPPEEIPPQTEEAIE